MVGKAVVLSSVEVESVGGTLVVAMVVLRVIRVVVGPVVMVMTVVDVAMVAVVRPGVGWICEVADPEPDDGDRGPVSVTEKEDCPPLILVGPAKGRTMVPDIESPQGRVPEKTIKTARVRTTIVGTPPKSMGTSRSELAAYLLLTMGPSKVKERRP